MFLSLLGFIGFAIMSLVVYFQYTYIVKPLKNQLNQCQNNLTEETTLRTACEKHIRDMEIDYTKRLQVYANKLSKIKQENRFSSITPSDTALDECQKLKDMLEQYRRVELERLSDR